MSRRIRLKAGPQRRPQRPVRHHITHGRQALFGGIDAREAETTLIRDVNLAYRCRGRGHARPQSESVENSAAAVRYRSRTLIEARLPFFSVGNRLYQRYSQAKRFQCHGKAGADHASAHDGDVVGRRDVLPVDHAACSSDSIASGVFSSAAVNTSGASAVTNTSSSMRTPMFQNSAGTRGEGRM